MQKRALGTMLRWPECCGPALARLTEGDFDGDVCPGVYRALDKLHQAGAPIDRVSLRRELGEDYSLALEEIEAQALPEASDLEWYIDALRDYSRLAEIQAASARLWACDTIEAASPIVDEINAQMVQQRTARTWTGAELAQSFLARLDETPEYLPWGIRELDEGLHVKAGNLVILGGYPSSGKTLLALQCARVQAAAGKRVGFYSLETDAATLQDRMMSAMAQVPLSYIQQRVLADRHLEALSQAAIRLSRLPLEVVEASGMTVRDIRATALARRHEIVYVDYLQLIRAEGKDRYTQVTNISLGLHELAQGSGICVVALAQLARPEKTKSQKNVAPTMQSFKESGQIEQDADVGLLLWPEDMDDNRSNRTLKVAKQKEGEKLKLTLDFDGAVQTFREHKNTKAEQYQNAVAAGRQYAKAREAVQTQLGDMEGVPF